MDSSFNKFDGSIYDTLYVAWMSQSRHVGGDTLHAEEIDIYDASQPRHPIPLQPLQSDPVERQTRQD